MSWFQHFRILLPSWKFFEHIGHEPILSYRFRSGSDESQWTQIEFPRPKLSWKQLLLNPDGNLYWVYVSTLQTLVQEIQDHTDTRINAETFSSFLILQRWLSVHFLQKNREGKTVELNDVKLKNVSAYYQLKVSIREPHTHQTQDLLISNWYPTI